MVSSSNHTTLIFIWTNPAFLACVAENPHKVLQKFCCCCFQKTLFHHFFPSKFLNIIFIFNIVLEGHDFDQYFVIINDICFINCLGPRSLILRNAKPYIFSCKTTDVNNKWLKCRAWSVVICLVSQQIYMIFNKEMWILDSV